VAGLLKNYKLMVGFEFHCQMLTKHKLFSSATCSYQDEPNSHVAYVDAGLPGVLPVLNEECLEQAVKCSLALNGNLPRQIKFDRKHYLYQDLPSGYQITQKHNPIMQDGVLRYFNAENEEAHIPITRVQIEQDTAKTINHEGKSLIDYNRSGMPLLEIVTDAQYIENPEDCKLLVREMQELLSRCKISEAKIEKGQLRVDVNISVWDPNNEGVSTPRVEIKNVAGAKNVERCIEYELKRHVDILEAGRQEQMNSETRRYDASEGKTILMREKTEDPDYRFFQDPDLPNIEIDVTRIDLCQQMLPELPFKQKKRYSLKYNLDVSDVKIIFKNEWILPLFRKLVKQTEAEIVF